MSIYCIGQSVYDLTFPLEDAIEENKKYRIYDTYGCIGAPATNAASLCAKWGVETALIARVGTDIYGDLILNGLKEHGVDTTFVKKEEAKATAFSVILTNKQNGNRTILNNPSDYPDTCISLPDKSPKVLLMDGHELQTSLMALQKYQSAISILDAGSYHEATKRLAKEVDYVICSQDFAFQLSNVVINLEDEVSIRHVFSKIEELTKAKIVITLGEQGCLYKEETILHMPAYVAESVDTTGAGDIFHGAFAYAMEKDYGFVDALKLSSMSASLSVETRGGNLSIPGLHEVYRKLMLENTK